MEYQNPKIPEGINVTGEHPLKGFLYLLAAVSFAIIAIVLIISFSIGALVRFVPFEVEVALASKVVSHIEAPASENKNIDENSAEQLRHQRVTEYLQSLADQLSLAQQLPEEIKIKVHYLDEPVVNAFATLGGHIVIYQGLIDKLDSENALSMVVAHEIAHIKHRHPIIAMGRGVSIGLLLSAATGIDSSIFSGDIAGKVSLFTALAFNRSQETESDIEAYNALVNHYGHGRGATDLFFVLKKQEAKFTTPELLSSHPLSAKRIEKLKKLEGRSKSNCEHASEVCALTTLPDFLKSKIIQ